MDNKYIPYIVGGGVVILGVVMFRSNTPNTSYASVQPTTAQQGQSSADPVALANLKANLFTSYLTFLDSQSTRKDALTLKNIDADVQRQQIKAAENVAKRHDTVAGLAYGANWFATLLK